MGITKVIGINKPGTHMQREDGQVLGEISQDVVDHGQPMLSAMAVNREGKSANTFLILPGI
jgi:hypothetical protein